MATAALMITMTTMAALILAGMTGSETTISMIRSRTVQAGMILLIMTRILELLKYREANLSKKQHCSFPANYGAVLFMCFKPTGFLAAVQQSCRTFLSKTGR